MAFEEALICICESWPNMAAPERVEIEVGGKLYNISTVKIPYFASYLDFQCHSGQTSKKHDNIPFFEAAYQGAERSFRNCFRILEDSNVTVYHTLCDSLDFLCIDTLGDRSVDAAIKDLKSGKGHYEVDYKTISRDSCFRLLCLISRPKFEDDTRTSQQIYQAVILVVSHRAIPKYLPRIPKDRITYRPGLRQVRA